MNKVHDIIKVIGLMVISMLTTVTYVFAVNGGHLPRPQRTEVAMYESYISPIDQQILDRLLKK